MSLPMKSEVIVIGAGALGLATAAELVRRGLRPLVLDAGAPNASLVAAGMLAPAFEAVLEEVSSERADLYRLGRDFWPDLAERAGITLNRSGADWIGPVEPLASRMSELGFVVEAAPGGFRTPDDWTLNPETALPRLAAHLAEGGGAIHTARVEALEVSRSGVEVYAGDARFAAEAVVIAAGWAAPALAAPLGLAGGLVRPVKGHILKLAGEGTGQVERVTRAPGVYFVPRADGLVVGATMQPDRSDVVIEPEVVEALHRAAAAVFPALAAAKIAEARAGIRGSSPDGLPLAGAAGASGVHLALAPRRNGWLLAPLVARSVAATLLGGDDPAGGALRPDRFQAPGGGRAVTA